jgi:hypothetical protein
MDGMGWYEAQRKERKGKGGCAVTYESDREEQDASIYMYMY